ncbi:uncharacterized protein LOC127709411 [Mytilus californianus]|uniref:uncharacterized protein LOC127709411 n=1 Tax=Mytilus californianus TaxID=6549 RepID=UPI002246ABDF|nr:uncharacterized protein LOC127709411 [Mytilus californianus]XP_052070901.1 uncharacterized protein LOC127709411 [Mytilus californianus]XP_052070903.1 uncharacterized protein LOC127709411 [Mytilus californianus]XP_052070904.1 uncharacterized protein LOC127709411 [Mytilus californianus]
MGSTLFMLLVTLILLKELIEVKCICFTSTWKRNELQLICTINHLIYDVTILDQNGKEQASCLIPSFESKCVSYHSHGHISQDIVTNKTIFKVWQFGHGDSFDGNWTCRHGRGKEQATTEVSLEDYSNGIEKYSLWTFIGFIPTLLLMSTLQCIRILGKHSSGCCRNLALCKCSNSQRNKKQISRIVCNWLAYFIFVVVFSALPICLDFFGTFLPISEKFFIADGIMLGIWCHLISNIDGTEESESKLLDEKVHELSETHEPHSIENQERASLLSKISTENKDLTSKDVSIETRDTKLQNCLT